MGWGGSDGLTAPTATDVRSWPAPNFIDPQSREWIVIGVEAPLTFLAAVVVVARFYARTCIKRVLGWDDWLMMAAMVLSTITTILHCLATQYAAGLHIWDIRYSWVAPTGKLVYATMILFAPTASLAKISLSLTHLRILPSTSDRMFARGAIVFSVCYGISITTVMIFQCWPINSYWDPSIANYECIQERAFNYASQALNSTSDFLIFLWPIRTLWTVRVPLKQRLGLVFIFSVGAVVFVAGVFRIYYLYRYFHSPDIYWEGAIIFVLACIETNVGIICGCLPGIKPLLSRLFPKTFGSSIDPTSGSYSHHRLPGQRLSIRVPPSAMTHRPSSASMVEVPVKLEHAWGPISQPQAATTRIMSSPEFSTAHVINLREFLNEESAHSSEEPSHPRDPHPGTRVSQV